MSPALLYDSLAICAFWAFLLRSLANMPEILQLIGLKKWKNLKTTKDSCHCHWEYEIPVILDDIIHEPMSINFHELKQELLMLWVQQKSDVPSKFLHDLAGSRVLHWRFAPGDPKWNQTTSWTGVFSSQLALGFVLIIPPPQRKVSVVFALKKNGGPAQKRLVFCPFFGGDVSSYLPRFVWGKNSLLPGHGSRFQSWWISSWKFLSGEGGWFPGGFGWEGFWDLC